MPMLAGNKNETSAIKLADTYVEFGLMAIFRGKIKAFYGNSLHGINVSNHGRRRSNNGSNRTALGRNGKIANTKIIQQIDTQSKEDRLTTPVMLLLP